MYRLHIEVYDQPRSQSFWLMPMRSRVRFPVLPWGFFLKGGDSHGDHGLGSLVELRLRSLLVLYIHISPSTSSGQRNCASWASQPQKSVTLLPCPGGRTTKSTKDMWRDWTKKKKHFRTCFWHLNSSLNIIWLTKSKSCGLCGAEYKYLHGFDVETRRKQTILKIEV